jgi:excinuclease ABC subunit C
MKFEKAEVMRQKIDALQQYQSKSTVVNAHLGNLDVATIIRYEESAFVNYMMISEGSVIYAKTIEAEIKVDEEDSDILALALDRLRETFKSNAKEVIVPVEIEVTNPNVKVTVPKAGDKKKLLDMSYKNAEIFRDEVRKRDTLLLGDAMKKNSMRVLEELQEKLQLPDLPVHIECFDNSNFQGSYPVSAMVCFRNGQPSKKDYRHYHIKTVEGINDFASMSEVVYRRYKRLTEEGNPLPQLVIIDGGKGQLGAAMDSIQKLGLTGRMTVVGLAKREESIFFPGDSEPLQLPYDSQAHLLIRRIRDEVHRFGITFHRQTRSKGTFKNELESISGIGEKTATELLQTFRSVKNVRELTERELTKAIGLSKARIVWAYFHATEGDPTSPDA